MFRFEENRTYQMPVHFGPCCGPRQNPDGKRFFADGPQESTQHTLVYETEPEAVSRFLPERFSLRKPYILATHKMHRNLPWLAGRGYNVVTFNVPVSYEGLTETVHGQYQLAIWENHADPIICGREQLGYAKIFADIQDMHIYRSKGTAALSSWDFRFLELSFDLDKTPEDEELLKSIVLDPENQGLMHYKYIPKTGDGFSSADVACITITPKEFVVPEEAAPVPPASRSWITGNLAWHIPTWNDMPTQYHVVQGLAFLPVKRIIGATKYVVWHYNDVFHQRVLL